MKEQFGAKVEGAVDSTRHVSWKELTYPARMRSPPLTMIDLTTGQHL